MGLGIFELLNVVGGAFTFTTENLYTPFTWGVHPQEDWFNVPLPEQRLNEWKKQFLIEQDAFLVAQGPACKRRIRIGMYVMTAASVLFLIEAGLAYFSAWSI